MGNTEIERQNQNMDKRHNFSVNIRSYEICMDEGQKLRRNRRDIRVSKCKYDIYTLEMTIMVTMK